MDVTKAPTITLHKQIAYRLITTKFPPVHLFDDVASADEFETIYAIQALTNPRLQNEIGDLQFTPQTEIPFGIKGCSYTIAPFTHINPDGSRFSDGSFGVLYLADTIETAIAESAYHQEIIFKNIVGLRYDTIIMRGLKFVFSGTLINICETKNTDLYSLDNYSEARKLGKQIKEARLEGLQYSSVRHADSLCWALFTPKNVKSATQTTHYEFVFDGKCISHKRKITGM